MAKKKVPVSAFVDTTLKTTALLTFIDPETREQVTDEFTVEYFALSPKQADELDEWKATFEKRLIALEERESAHLAAEARRRLQHDVAEAEREEQAKAANEAFVPKPFEEQPFEDPEEKELKFGLAQFVKRMVSSIPEIVEGEGEKERPAELTVEVYAGWAAKNLRSLRDAVLKDTATDPTKPASSPSS